MYGLNKDTDLSFFVGRTLVQACFGAHDLVLNFDARLSVTITSTVECGARDCSTPIEDFVAGAPILLRLVNHVVVSANAIGRGTLELTFNNNDVLRLVDDTPHYESYVIRNGEDTIVV